MSGMSMDVSFQNIKKPAGVLPTLPRGCDEGGWVQGEGQHTSHALFTPRLGHVVCASMCRRKRFLSAHHTTILFCSVGGMGEGGRFHRAGVCPAMRAWRAQPRRTQRPRHYRHQNSAAHRHSQFKCKFPSRFFVNPCIESFRLQ